MSYTMDLVRDIQERLPIKKRVFDTELNSNEIAVLYEFTQSEADTWNVQGTGLKIDILAVHFKGIDIFDVLHPEQIIELETEILEYILCD